MKHNRKLFWTFTLILVASTAVFLTAFTSNLTTVSAQSGECPVDRKTKIAKCENPIPERERGVKIPETCVQACIDANGFPVRFGSEPDLHCSSVVGGDVRCPGVKDVPAIPATQTTPAIPATQSAPGVSLEDPFVTGLIEQEKAVEKECSGILHVGCWVKNVFNIVKNLPVTGPAMYVIIPLYLIATVTNIIASALVAIMVVFAKVSMGIGVTPENNEFVAAGLAITQGIVNGFFILILAFIGLATILRLQAYQLQKTLPALIIMALFVNFSSVLVGLIVDMGNILASFFLSKVGSLGNIVQQQGAIVDQIWEFIKAPGFGNVFAQLAQTLAQIITVFIFNFALALVVLGMFLLFVVRVAVLWIIAILAPFAFAAYILPATRSFFSDWWKQLIQWSFIGVPMGFFLYIATLLVPLVHDLCTPIGTTIFPVLPSGCSGLSGIFASLIAPLAIVLILIFGLTTSLSLAPSAAQKVINFAGKKWGKKIALSAATVAGTAAWRRLGGRFEQAGAALRQRGETPAVVPGNAGLIRKTASVLGKYTGIAQGNRFLLRWAGRGIESGSETLTTQMHNRDAAEMKKAKGAATNQAPDDNFARFKKAVYRKDWNSAVGWLNGTFNPNGDSDEMRRAADSGKIKWEDVNTAFEHAQRHGDPTFLRPFLKAFPDKMQDPTKPQDPNKPLKPNIGNFNNIWEKWKPQDITEEYTDLDNIKNTRAGEEVLENMFLKSDSNITTAAVRHPKKLVRDWVRKYAESLGPKWFITNNRQDTLNAIISSGGRTMGVPLFSGLTRDGINQMVAEATDRYTDQELQERLTALNTQLDDIRGREAGGETGLARTLSNLQRQVTEVGESLLLRRTPTAELQTTRVLVQRLIHNLDTGFRSGTINEADYHRNKAPAQRELNRIDRELARPQRP